MRTKLYYTTIRMDHLIALWIKEWDLWLLEMTQAKLAYETRFLKQMETFNNKGLVTKLLKLYLDRCRWKHNLAFF